MYPSVIFQAVKNLLVNSALSDLIPPNGIQITPDPRPWPTVGTSFVTIHPQQRYNPSIETLLIEDRLSFAVTVGLRTRIIPTDRLADKIYMDEGLTLGIMLELVIILISTSYSSLNEDIIAQMNTLIATYGSNISSVLGLGNRQVVDGFRYLDADAEPTPQMPDFFSSRDSAGTPVDRPAGHTLTARFLAPSQLFAQNCQT